jgi:hypothetical protein
LAVFQFPTLRKEFEMKNLSQIVAAQATQGQAAAEALAEAWVAKNASRLAATAHINAQPITIDVANADAIAAILKQDPHFTVRKDKDNHGPEFWVVRWSPFDATDHYNK